MRLRLGFFKVAAVGREYRQVACGRVKNALRLGGLLNALLMRTKAIRVEEKLYP